VFLKQKKGAYFFIMDVLLGVFIFVITIILLSTFHSSTPSLIGVGQVMDNIYQEVYLTPVIVIGVTSNPVLQNLSNQGLLTNEQLTIDQLLMWLHENKELLPSSQTYGGLVKDLLGNATTWVPPQYGYRLYMGNKLLYEKNSSFTSFEESIMGISRYKITVLNPSIQSVPAPSQAINTSEVIVWQ
jgi:hypothetical protein